MGLGLLVERLRPRGCHGAWRWGVAEYCDLFEHLGSSHQLNMPDFTASQGYSLGRFQSFLALFHGWSVALFLDPLYSLQSARSIQTASLSGKGVQLEFEEFLVLRKVAISPLESWLTARRLFHRLDVGVPVTVAPSQFYVIKSGKDIWKGSRSLLIKVWSPPGWRQGWRTP